MNFNLLKIISFALATTLIFTACEEESPINNNPSPQRTELYASNNNDGNVTVYDRQSNETQTQTTSSSAAEGIYYDGETDEVIQASRSFNRLNVYGQFSTLPLNALLSISFSSDAELSSPRDMAVQDNLVVVADNTDVDGNMATADGRLFIYTKGEGSLTLRNIVTTEFAVWGIEFVEGDLYAVVDKTNKLAVFENFLANNTTNATVRATKTVAIEGIVRTHGIAYDGGTMILTDVGDAASQTDGAFHIITDFEQKFSVIPDGAMMPVANTQVRVEGAATMMGNPVAAEYDAAADMVYIAEAANGGGRVLGYSNATVGGNLAPNMNQSLAKASSLYLYRE